MVTAINAAGETVPSNEQSITTGAGSTNSNTVNWAAVTGATGYKIYRTASGGGTGTELLLATVGAVITFLDTGSASPAGALPTLNTAFASGVYTAPTKFFPFINETLKSVQNTTWRRPIRQSPDVIGAVPGDFHIEGDMELEALEDVLPYFLFAARTSCVKSGAGNYTYVFTPTATAIPARTLSITIERVSGAVFGYVGMVVSAMKFTVTNGELMVTMSLLGRDEASASVPTPTFPTTTPFGAGQYIVEIPTGTQVYDTDTFEFNIDDSGDSQFRLKNTGRGAQFIKYGERSATLKVERDFIDRSDYDAFKAYTAQLLQITATQGINNSVVMSIPVGIKDTYEVNLSGQGDLVRATVQYQLVIGSPATYTLTVKTQENLN
jgi:hypothetical protein